MIKTANRLEGISEYYFAAKLREIAQMRAAGTAVLNLGIGSPDLPPAPEVMAALRSATDDPRAHGYQSYTGIPALRQAWADWYERFYSVRLSAEGEILPLIGSKEGILHIAMTFLEAGDVALVPNPGYPTYRAASMLAGAEVQFYELQEANGWLPDFEKLEQLDLRRAKILWVNFPNMPTGTPATPQVFQQLVDFARRHNLLVVNDNPYSFILNEKPLSILTADGAAGVALELNSLSKSHNLAGWRVGMVAGHSDLVKNVLRFKSNMDSGQPLPLQLAAIEALNLPDSWYQNLNSTYRERQSAAFRFLKKLGCSPAPDQQGLFLWAKIPAGFSSGFELSDDLLRRAAVFITPGGIFGSAGEGFIRVSLCSEVSVFSDAIHQVDGWTGDTD